MTAHAAPLRKSLEAKLNELERLTLDKEQSLTHLPDTLVGVGYPGNNIADGVTSGDPSFLSIGKRRHYSLLWLDKVRVGHYVTTEWALRVAMSCGLAVALALQLIPLPINVYVNFGLMAVLATAQAKPTLGDALEGSWIALSGAALGFLLALPALAVAVFSTHAALVVWFVHTFALAMMLGDQVQVGASKSSLPGSIRHQSQCQCHAAHRPDGVCWSRCLAFLSRWRGSRSRRR